MTQISSPDASLSSSPAPRRRMRGALLGALACLTLLLCPGATSAAAAGTGAVAPPPEGRSEPTAAVAPAARPAPHQAAVPVTVAIDRQAPGHPVPARFLGLSFEAAALGQIVGLAGRGDLVRMLRSLGPGMLRFGGITADQNVAWTDAATPRPAWATSVIGPAQMRQLGVLARRSGWQVLLTVGLAHYEPEAAAREVAAAHAALGPYLAAVEIGNEPDSYGRHGFRELPWLVQGYEEQVSAYREAIGALTPGVPIAGPDSSGSGLFPEWGYAEAVSQTPALLTGHHYPLGCSQMPSPSIEALLSPATRGREARSLATYLSISQAYDIPLRVDEAGSVSCGGVPGISNTFASALWATAYITQAMAAGVAGINLQGNPTNCEGYTPLCAPTPSALAAGALRAQPAWYGLLLTRSLIGERPVPTTIGAARVPNLVATAFSGPGGLLKLVLVDDEPPGSSPLALRVQVGAGEGAASVQRLAAPSLQATGGLLLAGRSVAPDGIWSAPPRARTAAVRAGLLDLRLAPSTASLVTIESASRPSSRHRRSG
ncbi:MAG: hypothetical protein ACLQBB_01130 [Solirubrobacteraceae bacterium]